MNWNLTKIIQTYVTHIWKKQYNKFDIKKNRQTLILSKLAMPNDLKNTSKSSYIKTHKVAGQEYWKLQQKIP